MDKQQTNNKVEVIMIRHGQSEYNYQAQVLRNKLNIGATWQQYKQNPQFMEFKYCDQMMDCTLSEKGIQQCMSLRNSQKISEILNADLVLVSPLYRALKTCYLLVNETQAEKKVIVDPIFSQSLRCTCDVSRKLFQAKQDFNKFDYSKIQGKQSTWYIDNQQPQKRELYQKIMLQNNSKTYEQRAKTLTKYMGQTYNFQDAHDLIKRMKTAKQHLKQYAIKHNCKKIVLVSHFYSIIYMTCLKFSESGKPIPYPFINNATPMKYYMDTNKDIQNYDFLRAQVEQEK